jgi:hypothetical protein
MRIMPYFKPSTEMNSVGPLFSLKGGLSLNGPDTLYAALLVGYGHFGTESREHPDSRTLEPNPADPNALGSEVSGTIKTRYQLVNTEGELIWRIAGGPIQLAVGGGAHFVNTLAETSRVEQLLYPNGDLFDETRATEPEENDWYVIPVATTGLDLRLHDNFALGARLLLAPNSGPYDGKSIIKGISGGVDFYFE